MKIAIIGTVVYDTIVNYNGDIHNGFGGITFNTLALGKLLSHATSTVYPISIIGEDRYREFSQLVNIYSNISIDGLYRILEQTANSYLTYSSPNDRTEQLITTYPPLSYQHIVNFLHSDVILVNFISGNDLSLTTLRKIKDRSSGLLYMDLHCITMQMDSMGKKHYQYFSCWQDWVSCVDIVQMNKREVQSLFKEKIDFSSLNIYIDEILKVGVKIAIVTLGDNGVYIGFKAGGKSYFKHIPPEVKNVIDPTGCGDVFSAAFIIRYTETSDPVESAKYANQIAGLNGQYHGIEWFLAG